MAYKRIDQWSVILVSIALESMDDVSSVQRREKGSTTKSVISCPNVLKLYNNGMGEVDLMDQRTAAYLLDQIANHFFVSICAFDFLDFACGCNSFLVYNVKHPKQLTFFFSIITIYNWKQKINPKHTTVPQYQCYVMLG